jgi:hypothetical protein
VGPAPVAPHAKQQPASFRRLLQTPVQPPDRGRPNAGLITLGAQLSCHQFEAGAIQA